MFKRASIIAVITLVVASLAIVVIAKYQRVVQPAISRGLSTATDRNGSLSNLEADRLIPVDQAMAAPDFAKGKLDQFRSFDSGKAARPRGARRIPDLWLLQLP